MNKNKTNLWKAMKERKCTLIIVFILFLLPYSSLKAANSFLSSVETTLRLGWSVGGTMPLGMPETIRGLNQYSLRANLQVGAWCEYPLSKRWNVSVGLGVENKSMKTDARVKTYHMKMVQGGDAIEGYFSGNVVTQTRMWQIAIPLQMVFKISPAWKVRGGLYLAFAFDKSFEGYAYDGYLRVDTPIGPRVDIGNTETTRGDYDFSSDFRGFNLGMDIGVQWQSKSPWGVYAGFTMSFNGAFPSSFKTIEQTMQHLFGSIGVSYLLRK